MGDLRTKFNSVQSGVIHTSGFAKANDSTATSFGTASSESFNQRLAVERNRQHVQGFGSAGVLHGYRAEAKLQSPGNRQGANISPQAGESSPVRQGNRLATGHPETTSRQSFNARSSTRLAVPTRFHEPTPRRYNPYG